MGLIEAIGVGQAFWNVGDVVRKLRMLKGWKGADLARKAKVDKSAISRLEQNGGEKTTIATLTAIAVALDVTVADLAAGCSSTPTAPTPAAVTPPVVVAPVSDLRWDIIAPGCVVAKPVPMLNDRMADSRTQQGDSIKGLWLMSSTRTGSRRTDVFTEGVFQRSGNVWALCSWQMLARDTIE